MEVYTALIKTYYPYAEISAGIAGYPIQPLWIFQQWKHETANFTSDLCRNYYNLGGLTQSSNNGLPQPDGDMFYMQFVDLHDFARYFGYYLRLYADDGLYSAFTLQDYLLVLKNGGYYGDTYENYLKGCEQYEKA